MAFLIFWKRFCKYRGQSRRNGACLLGRDGNGVKMPIELATGIILGMHLARELALTQKLEEWGEQQGLLTKEEEKIIDGIVTLEECVVDEVCELCGK